MFRGGFGMFDGNDPFFRDIHMQMNSQLQQMDMMMNDMFDPMAGLVHPGMANPRQQMIQDHAANQRAVQRAHSHHAGHHHNDMMMSPFGFGGGGLLGGGGLFGGIQSMMQQMTAAAAADPNSHVMTHSQVIAFDGSDPSGQPRVYESSNTTRRAGQVRETRKTVRDSATGDERISIGHFIGQRGHEIEKRRRGRDVPIEHDDRYYGGLKPEEARRFDQEFGGATNRRTRIGYNRSTSGDSTGPPPRQRGRLTIADVTDEYDSAAGPSTSSGSRRARQASEPRPIIEEAD